MTCMLVRDRAKPIAIDKGDIATLNAITTARDHFLNLWFRLLLVVATSNSLLLHRPLHSVMEVSSMSGRLRLAARLVSILTARLIPRSPSASCLQAQAMHTRLLCARPTSILGGRDGKSRTYSHITLNTTVPLFDFPVSATPNPPSSTPRR